MKKGTKFLIAVIVIVIVVFVLGELFIANNSTDVQNSNLSSNSTQSSITINSADDLSALVEKIYEGEENLYGSLATMEIDLTDEYSVKSYTGLDSADSIEYGVVSEPMISSQAYSLVILKVKDGINADEIAKEMNENIDQAKWICVSAEKVYTTSSDNLVFLVMADEEMAKPIYEKFKSLAGNIGQEYEKTEEDIELAPEMY
jgi:hypothetical protein